MPPKAQAKKKAFKKTQKNEPKKTFKRVRSHAGGWQSRMAKYDARIKELEAENARLRAELRQSVGESEVKLGNLTDVGVNVHNARKAHKAVVDAHTAVLEAHMAMKAVVQQLDGVGSDSESSTAERRTHRRVKHEPIE